MIEINEEIHKEYDMQIEKMLADKFKDKTVQDISNLPVEEILSNQVNEEYLQKVEKINNILNAERDNYLKNKHKEKSNITKNIKTVSNDIFDMVVENDKISISKIQRYFCISYPRGAKIIEDLLQENIIKKEDVGYLILNKIELKQYLKNIFAQIKR